MLNKKLTYLGSIALVALASLTSLSMAKAQNVPDSFDANYIIGDQEILNESAMSLAEITEFINNKGGYLAKFKTASCTEEDVNSQRPCSGPIKSAAEIIHDRAVTNKVNPRFLLVLLQKEQSLIEAVSPSQTALDWAVGYGCFDGQACNERWRGFWKQVNSASLQFRDYMDSPQLYNFKAGNTYTVFNTNRDPQIVTPVNQATAALYNYTPHVYNGNYNFYKIWQRWFSRNYPNGTLLQVDGDPVVWILQNGKKRPFASRGALTSRYNPNMVIKVGKGELDKYEKGAPIKFPQFSLVRSPKGAVYLIIDDTKRGFTSQLALRKTGINPEEIMDVSQEDLNSFKEGAPITATTTAPAGQLTQDKKTGGVYYVIDGQKAPVIDRVLLTTKFKNRPIVKADTKTLNKYATIEPVKYDDGALLKSPSNSAVYIIADGKKNPITSGALFEKLGYRWENVISVSPKLLYLYPQGISINDNASLNAMTAANTAPSQASVSTSTTALATSSLVVN